MVNDVATDCVWQVRSEHDFHRPHDDVDASRRVVLRRQRQPSVRPRQQQSGGDDIRPRHAEAGGHSVHGRGRTAIEDVRHLYTRVDVTLQARFVSSSTTYDIVMSI